MPGYEKFYSVYFSIKTNLIGPQTPVQGALKCCALYTCIVMFWHMNGHSQKVPKYLWKVKM